jgi:hypothetical protein
VYILGYDERSSARSAVEDPGYDPGPDPRKDPGPDPLKDPGPDPLKDPGQRILGQIRNQDLERWPAMKTTNRIQI